VKRNSLSYRTALVIPALIAFAGCASSSKEVVGLRQVDGLVGRVERVYVEAEISGEAARRALKTFEALVAPELDQDPILAFGEFVAAVDASELQAKALGSTIDPLRSSADKVFAQWTTDLETYTTDTLRQRSKVRLEETRARYTEVLTAVQASHQAYVSFNQRVRDYAKFLGHDFNPAAVAALREDVDSLTELDIDLEERLEACMKASEGYVKSAALPGTLELRPSSRTEGVSASEEEEEL